MWRAVDARLFLFDIDQTLILGAGCGRRALERAFHALCKRPVHLGNISMNGKTDTAILDEMAAALGMTLSPLQESALWDSYITCLEEELVRTAEARVNPGIPEILQALRTDPRARLGLLTGNIYRGAKAKLSHFDLWRHFPTGGFGDDDRNRNVVAGVALKRCSDHFGIPFSVENVYVIGDSLRDIACAEAIGAKPVIVATGLDCFEELAARKPFALVRDFSDAGTVLALLQG